MHPRLSLASTSALLILTAATSLAQSAGDYRSKQSGDWNVATTWQRFDGISWVDTTTTPSSSDGIITVRSPHTVTITASATYDQVVVESGAQVTVSSGVTHTLANGAGTDLTINGTWLNQGGTWTVTGASWGVNSGGTFIHNATSGISTPLGQATLATGSTFIYRGSSTLTPTMSFSGRTFGNLSFESSSGSWSTGATTGSSALTVNGNLSVGSGVTWSIAGASSSFSGNIQVNGTTTIDGIWTATGTSTGSLGTHTFTGSFTANGTYSVATAGTTQGDINFKGNLVNNGTFTTPSNRNIVFNGTSVQTISGTSTTTFNNGFIASQSLTIASAANLQAAAGKLLTVTNDLTVNSGGIIAGAGSMSFEGYDATFANNGTVDVATTFEDNDGDVKSLSGIGFWSFLTIASSCSTTVGGAHTFTGAPSPFTVSGSVTLSGGSTVIYKGTSVQTVAPLSYSNLEIDNSAGATLIAASTVNGDLGLTSGQFNIGTNLTLGSSASITRRTGSLLGTPNFGSSINVEYIGTVAAAIGSEVPNASTVLYNLHINNSGGVTLSDPATVNGSLNVLGGNLVTGSYILTLGGSAAITETAPYSVVGNLRTTRSCTTGVNQTFGAMGMEINASGAAPGSTTVTRVTGTASTVPTGPTILRYFDVASATNSGLNATMVFRYTDGELNGRTESKLILFKSTNSGTTWTAQGGAVNTTANTVTLAGIDAFSRWTGGESYPTPTLASISPTSGTKGATLTVNFTGTGFLSGVTGVGFDTSITVNSVTVNSSTSLTANITISASTSTGLRSVSVTNPSPGGGTATLVNAFNVIIGNPLPTLTSISPNTAGLGATLEVVITGTGFASGVSTPDFGSDITLNSLTVNSSTQMTANISVSPTGAIGARSVSVTNSSPGGGTATLTNALTVVYPPPTLGSISPNAANRGQTLNVVFTGEGYYAGTTSVSFGANVTVNSLTITNTTQLTANITVDPNAATGLRGVTANNSDPGGGSSTLQNAFTINNPAPTLTSVSPANGNRNQTLSVVVRGSNFLPGISSVNFGPDITVSSTTVDSSTQITASISISASAATGSRNVTVTHPAPGGGTATLTDAFTIGNPAPSLTNVSPNTGARGETMSVTLTGSDFIDGVSSASFGAGITMNFTTVNSATQMAVNITIALDAALEPRDISVTNADPGGGTATLSSAFSVINPAPTLASIAPTSGSRGQTLNVTVTGTNFIPGVTTFAYGSGITINSMSAFIFTQVTASVTIDIGTTPGSRDITATNAAPGGGSATLTNAFTVTNPLPTLTGASPNRAGRGSKVNVVLTGTNFLAGVSSVSFGPDVTVNSITMSSITQMLVNISVSSSASTGARNVSVTNATPGGGTATLTAGFTVDTSPATSVENTLSAIPEDYALHEAYPNPFNPSTKIRYGLPERSRVKLEVYNMLGNVVADLASGERSKGFYEVEWIADNLPSGVYLVRLFSESVETNKRFIASRKVVLVK